jgi:hypothetical protein
LQSRIKPAAAWHLALALRVDATAGRNPPMPPLDLAVVVMPLMLLHAPSLAEGSIAVVDLCFLARSILDSD